VHDTLYIDSRPASAAGAASARADCDLETRRRGGNTGASNHNSSSNSSNDSDNGRQVTELSLRQGDCSLAVRIVGTVRFADDESDIADLPRGASVRVIQDDHGVERRFDASWQGVGVQRRWREDGRDVPETAE